MAGLRRSLIACLLITQYLSAQSSAMPRERKWELEIHASGFLKDDADGGVKRMPGPGTPFATIAPNVDSRLVSSFLFGDGNALLNQVLLGNGLNPIPSLDSAILNNRRALERQSNMGVGLRLSRYVTKRVWFDWTNEYDIDYDHGSFEINEKERADSFRSMQAWVTSLESLLGKCGKSCFGAVAARELNTQEKGHQFSSALTANYDLSSQTKFVPYIGGGIGLVMSFAGTPRQEYVGHFSLQRSTIQGTDRLEGTDHVKVNFQVPTVVPALIMLAGGKYQLNGRWGLRMEMRNNLEAHSYKTLVSAAPEFSTGGAGNAIVFSSGGVGVQFSDDQSLAPSSLSSPLPQFRTFKSTGLRYEGRISGGIFYSF